MNIWKIGSRWGDDGNTENVFDLFQKYNIAFVYDCNIKTKEVSLGDLFAISNGYKIVSIGKVETKATPINEFKISALDVFNTDKCTIGFRVKIIDLYEKDIIIYGRRGRFHKLHNNVRDRIIQLWEQRETMKKVQ